MLSDKEEAEEARIAYEALPGTPPDAFNTRQMAADPLENKRLFEEMGREAKASGMNWARFTIDDGPGWLWCEMWKYRPYKEAPFSPMYTLPRPYAASEHHPTNGDT